MIQRGIKYLGTHKAPLLKGTLRFLLVLLLAGVVVQVFAPGTYRVSEGLVTFQLEPSWPGGRVIMPLGPAGVLELHTHHTPVDLKLDFALSAAYRR